MILIKDLDKRHEASIDKLFEEYSYEVFGSYIIKTSLGPVCVPFYLNSRKDICEV